MEASMMIGKSEDYPKAWKSVKSIEHAKYLVDVGTILSWDEVKGVRKALGTEKLSELLRHFAVRFSETRRPPVRGNFVREPFESNDKHSRRGSA